MKKKWKRECKKGWKGWRESAKETGENWEGNWREKEK